MNLITYGKPIAQASKALVMVHGRGASAEDVLGLTEYLSINDFAILAPHTADGSWYPRSFLAPPEQNEPWLSSSLNFLSGVMTGILNAGIQSERIYWLGFSQGACLVLEYAARNAQRFGGIIAFTGGLIGDRIYAERYTGDFTGTPVFIGSSDPDPHVPIGRVNETAALFKMMNAHVTLKLYANMGHTINDDEIKEANAIFHYQ